MEHRPHGLQARLRVPTLDRLAFWRSVLGLVTVVLVSLDYRPADDVVIGEPGGKMATAAFLGLAAVPVLMLATFLATPPHARPRLRLGLRRLLAKLGLVVITIGPPLTFFLVLDPTTVTRAVPVPVALLLVIAASWFLVYFLCVIYWAARTAFWIGEFHPLLAPVASTLIVLVTTVSDLIEWDSKGLPFGVWLLFTCCGLTSTALLAAAENRHLRASGVSLSMGG